MAPSQSGMRYRSTRAREGGATNLSFEQALFEGLAPDGGLFVPLSVPDVTETYPSWSSLSFADLATEIASLYISDNEVPKGDLQSLLRKSYASFSSDSIVPTVKVGELHVMELFHGPTFAFKDVALQALGNLYEYFLKRKSRRLTVVGATSGDTGSAAIYGLRGKANIDCFILFPEGRVSPIQQQQMTSVLDSNVHCVAVKGTFDDCQDIVKALFGDLDFKKEFGLGAVNSINWARIMFQITYYFYTYFRLFPNCDGKVTFSVPTGNFGDVLAGYYAKRMGLPVERLLVATNDNDILDRFFADGKYDRRKVVQTTSPSMDIGISSNFERYLFYLFKEDPRQLSDAMARFNKTGQLHVGPEELATAQGAFASCSATETQVKSTVAKYFKTHGYTLDPHTACGVWAVEQLLSEGRLAPRRDPIARAGARGDSGDAATPHEIVCLGTAHPAKFGEAVASATGRSVVLPPALARLEGCKTRCQTLENSTQKVRELIEHTASSSGSICDSSACGACGAGLLRLFWRSLGVHTELEATTLPQQSHAKK